MYTIREMKEALNFNGNNTLLGMHLNRLNGRHHKEDNAALYVDEFSELLVYSIKTFGLDLINDGFRLGTVTFVYYSFKADTMEKEYKLKRIN